MLLFKNNDKNKMSKMERRESKKEEEELGEGVEIRGLLERLC